MGRLNKRQWIRSLSLRQQDRLKLYRIRRDAWSLDPRNQWCAIHLKLENQKKRAEPNPHHIRGRLGPLLCDTRFWLAVCQECHDRIHREPAWAREHGWLGPWHKIDDL